MPFRPQASLVETGTKFRPANSNLGPQSAVVWMVEAIHRGTDGHHYARLVSTTDSTRRKSISLNALRDPAFFLPLEV